MKKDELFHAGKIVRTFGSKGEVVISFIIDISPFIKKMEWVFILIKENPIPFFIDTLQPKNNNQYTVKFLDIESMDDCKEILDCDVYLPPSLLPKKSGKNFYTHEIKGFKVIDENAGFIGTLDDIIELQHQTLLSIKGETNEIFIPLVEAFIKGIDKKGKSIFTDIPEGLVDLNA